MDDQDMTKSEAMTESKSRTAVVDLDDICRRALRKVPIGAVAGPIDELRDIVVDFQRARFDGRIDYNLPAATSSTKMDTIDQIEQSNNTSQIQVMKIARSETISNSYTWATELGFSASVAVTATIKVPFIGGMDTSVGTNFSFSSTRSKTEEKSRTWQFEEQGNVAPRTRVTALLMIQKTTPRVPFTMTCAVTGPIPNRAKAYIKGTYVFDVWADYWRLRDYL